MILISAGHYPESPGTCYPANNPHWCEHAEAADWVNHIAILVRQQIKVEVVPTGPLLIYDKIKKQVTGGKVHWINEQCRRHNIKLAVEIHFNSDASKRAKGSETLYCPGSVRGEMLATIVQGAVASIFPPNRGPKAGWWKMDPSLGKKDYFLEKTHCPALIIEPEFIYNRSTIEANRHTGCEVIADALIEAARHV